MGVPVDKLSGPELQRLAIEAAENFARSLLAAQAAGLNDGDAVSIALSGVARSLALGIALHPDYEGWVMEAAESLPEMIRMWLSSFFQTRGTN